MKTLFDLLPSSVQRTVSAILDIKNPLDDVSGKIKGMYNGFQDVQGVILKMLKFLKEGLITNIQQTLGSLSGIVGQLKSIFAMGFECCLDGCRNRL